MVNPTVLDKSLALITEISRLMYKKVNIAYLPEMIRIIITHNSLDQITIAAQNIKNTTG